MSTNLSVKLTLLVAGFVLALPHAFAQKTCTGAKDTPLTGVIRDTTQALVSGATVTLDAAQTAVSGSDGQFRFDCVVPGQHALSVKAAGFSGADASPRTPFPSMTTIVLKPEAVVTDVTVDAGDASAGPPAPTASGPSQTLAGAQLQSLADDPDDLLRELQQLAAAAGGSGGSVAVDGFDSGEGTTHLPPKSSIAYIKINPDLFSAEYREPPFDGGRIEIYTRPGLPAFHGALFATNSSSWMNAHDPFSTAGTALGKQRYGFELTGPIRKKGSDFFASLEHRDIASDAVVNAITVNAAGVQTPLLQTAPAPQQMWIGDAKIDWQLGARNSFIAAVDTFNNDRLNQGVGGTFLAENGYEFRRYDTNIHLTDVTTISAKIMHEARIGLELDGFRYLPNSTAPQVSVAGAFAAGGGSAGDSHEDEIWSTIIDDAILQLGNHLVKAGIQPEFIHIHQHVPTNFNGTYSFDGGVTSTGAVITGIQQYVNALDNAANGSPTTFSNVAGNPEVDVFQFRNAVYVQDDWKIRSNLHFASGLRYYGQTHPTTALTLQPRFGVAWSPDKKATWSLHAHAGLFAGRNSAHGWATLLFSDGVERVTTTVYNPPAYCPGGVTPGCNPLAGATAIHTIRTVQPNVPALFYSIYNVGFSKSFPHGWTLSADDNFGELWHANRTENINSPTNGQPTGPRPLGANLNILQMQATGRGISSVQFAGLTNQSLKRVQFFAGVSRIVLLDDADNNSFFTPQTTGVNTGEYARRSGLGLWNIFGNATLKLPGKLVWTANWTAQGHAPYNITTGFDNNGDGDFNDRPQYALPGTPLCASSPTASPCGYATPWGELVSSGGAGSLSRNKGIMPWTVYVDSNLQRAFKLTRNPKAEHQQTLTLNLRSSNILNHTNATSVGGVLGSPLFGQTYAADNGRRVEVGARYAF